MGLIFWNEFEFLGFDEDDGDKDDWRMIRMKKISLGLISFFNLFV